MNDCIDCMLRVSGERMDVTQGLSQAPWPAVFDYEDAGRRGFNVVISRQTTWQAQVDEIEEFLVQYSADIRGLVQRADVEKVIIDCGRVLYGRRIAAVFTHFPVRLLELCSDCGVELEVSVYAGGVEDAC